MKFLSPDSGLMRGWNNLTDGVWINILMLVTSIPLVTVGAALTAGHDAARKTLAGEGHVTTNYFRSFKSNFVKSTVQWLIFGVCHNITFAGMAGKVRPYGCGLGGRVNSRRLLVRGHRIPNPKQCARANGCM